VKIESLKIRGFKSFKDITEVDLNKLTAFIGSNGSGKTAVLESLSRLFSTSKSLRSIQTTDFYIPLDEKLEDQEERSLSIEVKLAFPELATGENTDAISAVFRQMIVSEPSGEPYCRIRLEAKWINSAIQGGDIEEKIFWITTPNEIVEDTDKKPLNSADRAKIQLHYVPATRNPQEHLKQTSNAIMHKLLTAIEWSEEIKTELQSIAESIQLKFQSEPAINAIQLELTSMWNKLFTSDIYQAVNISPFSSDFEKILTKTEISFTPSIEGNEQTSERLSDGMKSLFYFTLIGTLFEIENKILSTTGTDELKMNRLNIPIFNIFAIEEPENHLAPHYLGRIMKVFRNISNSNRAQVLITSHTPTIIKRVEPEEIRHIRLDDNRLSLLTNIKLPEKMDEAFKYIKEAVKAYPELYFSKLVVFGEGDSEELVLAKIAEAHDILIDQAFISVVPLGGRFVNHFWKLLDQIGIPYITLLDYDKERGTDGGYGRIKYVLKQLLKLGIDKNILLRLDDGSILSDKSLDDMHTLVSDDSEQSWINMLKFYNIHFSYPLDIDFMMLEKFPTEYQTLSKGQRGPTIPNDGDSNYTQKVQEAIASVLKKTKKEDIEAINISDYPNTEYYFWYKYLFLGQGKPTSHLNALSKISDDDLKTNCPDALKVLIDNINTKMSSV